MQTTDTRPRVKYAFPDGRVTRVIIDHGEQPLPLVSCELAPSDPLWPSAQPVSAGRRIVWLSLAEGM